MSFSNEVITILNELGKRFGITIDWTKENVMPYIEELCQQIIKFETISYVYLLILCLLGIAIFVGWFVVFAKTYKLAKNTRNDNFCWESWYGGDIETSILGVILTIVAIIIGMFSTVGLFSIIYDLIKISCLPELYLLDFIQNLL